MRLLLRKVGSVLFAPLFFLTGTAFGGSALVGVLAFGLGTPLAAQTPLRVISWNVESGGAQRDTLARVVEGLQREHGGVALWGLSEVASASWAGAFEAAAERAGHGANYEDILGTTGSSDRLLILYDADRLERLGHEELHDINPNRNVRSALVGRFRDRQSGSEFFFMVNHLYRSNAAARHGQSRDLRRWVAAQSGGLPVIAVGDYNYDWDVANGDHVHDAGYDSLTVGDTLRWVRPASLQRTQCSRSQSRPHACRYNSVLDFVFVGGPAKGWVGTSSIVVRPGDFPDDDFHSDHRPVVASFAMAGGVEDIALSAEAREALLLRIGALEEELEALRALILGNQ